MTMAVFNNQTRIRNSLVNKTFRVIVIVHPHPNPPPSRGRELIRVTDTYSPSTGGRG
jgi:hypothetical protein